MGTEESFDGQGYIGALPRDIVVRLTETGSGIAKENIVLDISDINPAYAEFLQADNCTQFGNEYTCSWIGKISTKAHGASSLVFLVEAADSAGNTAAGITQATIGTDRRDPVIQTTAIRAFGEIQRPEGTAASNDEVIVTINGTDESGITAFADFSEIYDNINAQNLEAVCDKENDEYICLWDIPSVMSGYIDAKNIPLTVVDTAGNAAQEKIDIEVFAKDEEEIPDYWRVSSVELSPRAIDRQTAPLIRQRVYAAIDLEGISGAETIEINLGDCSGDIGFVNDISIFNNQRDSTSPYVILELKTIDVATNLTDLTVSCNLEIVSTYRNRLSNIEVEQTNITIPFYNNPLGEPSTQLSEKIADLRREYVDGGFFDLIGQIREIWHIASMICNIVMTIYGVVAVWGLVTTALGITAGAMEKTVIGFGPAKGLQAETALICHGTQALYQSTDVLLGTVAFPPMQFHKLPA